MNKRLKNIDKIVNLVKPQSEWDFNMGKKVDLWRETYEKELEDYVFIETEMDLKKNVKVGGYIRYFNANEELRYGGFLVSIFEDRGVTKLTLMNTGGDKWIVSWTRNYIFYKKHTTANDKLRKIFISLLEKNSF